MVLGRRRFSDDGVCAYILYPAVSFKYEQGQISGRKMKLNAAYIALLFVAATAVLAQLPDDLKAQFDVAERRIARLPPSAFPELPRNVVTELERRGCTVPQEAFTKKPHNVVKGQFARPGQIDWAVLCCTKGTSTILVFWGGSEKNPAAIAPREDRIFMAGITGAEIGYSRDIGPAGRAFIMRHYNAYGGQKPPPIYHEVIDDAFLEKASVTWYFYLLRPGTRTWSLSKCSGAATTRTFRWRSGWRILPTC
jgi:hypothetical protein